MSGDGPRVARAAFAYWAAIFALGFVLGTVRVLWGAEALGETAFVLVEVPLLLFAAWAAARALTRRHAIRTTGAAAAMGALAFVLLMGAELVLALTLGRQGPAQWFEGLWRMPHLLGTLGQILFGLMPVAVPEKGRARF